MELTGKLAALEKIYDIYDNFAASLELACKKYCAHCCTTSVTLTTIEGYKIAQDLASGSIAGWEEQVRLAAAQKHFKPKMTTNRFADLCAGGIEPPQEEFGESQTCPFLADKQCPLYAVRPFGCRCLVSHHDCGRHGCADIEDFVLSVNTVMLQAIEHLDAGGCSGNMLDVLNVFARRKNRLAYEADKLECASTRLIANQPLKILMIPPEHLTRMQPILDALREIRI